ncbi:cytochrome P450 [Streptomyces sp. NPDC056255]|uniref:cytochrome P450 n=1 Tax=Streptomyces sp. NPDC056255 TaxID=3345764 RepID=UPI0035E31F92
MASRVGASMASLPLAPGALPLLGHAAAMLRDPLAFLRSLPTDRPLLRLRLGPATLVLVCDPGLTHQVFLNDRIFDKGGPLYNRAREVVGHGLVTCAHRDHRRQRRQCQPSFRPDRLPDAVAAAVIAAREMISTWDTGQTVDITAQTMGFATRSTLGGLFTNALPDADTERIRRALTVIEEGIYRRTVTPAPVNRLPLPANRRYRAGATGLRREVAAIIAARRGDGRDHGDLLSALLGATGSDSSSCVDVPVMSETEVADQIQVFLHAGVEASAAALGWSLHLLAEHPPIAERLRAEYDAVLAGTPLVPGHLPHLTWTRAVVTEALRLYPPVWFLTRSVEASTELGGTRLPAGSAIALSPYLLHRRPELHHRPGHFDPGRWRGVRPARTTFLPFGAGARKCIGDRLGMDSVVAALAIVAGRWRLTPVAGAPVRPRAILSPRGLRLRVTAR